MAPIPSAYPEGPSRGWKPDADPKRDCSRIQRGRRLLAGDAITADILPTVSHEPAKWRHDVAAALESLPVHYRQIVLLRDVQGLTVAEIATQLALSRDAIKSRLHRARVLAPE